VARVCEGTTKAGAKCRAMALSDSVLCINHDARPEVREIARAGAVRGGEVRQYVASLEVPDVASPKAIRLLLSRVMREVAAGRMPTGVGFTLNSLCSTALQAMRTEREMQEPGKTFAPVVLVWPWQRDEAKSEEIPSA
jgi:hypothetical protein